MATNYPATISKLRLWLSERDIESQSKARLYGDVCKAIETGEGDPNNIILNGDQIAQLESDKVEIEQWIIAACDFVGIEPVEE